MSAPFHHPILCAAACMMASATANLHADSFPLASPDGRIQAVVTFHADSGTLTLRTTSRGVEVLGECPLGITTDQADFTSGLKPGGVVRATIDETYTLPHGKVSTYHNRANELTVQLGKDGRELHLVVRACDDGIAFRYVIPGSGKVEIASESTAFQLPGDPACWGQSHPNAYGYEFPLGRVEHESYSLALLCELKEAKHWVLLAQAATYLYLGRETGNPGVTVG